MSTSRRAFVGGALAAAALPAPAAPRAAAPFLWGVATAAHQIEGGNVNSDYWVLETIPHSGFKERSGDACDSWNRWREDVALIASMGLNAYRFSIEWARIEPEPGMFSNAALDHYRRICAACGEAGIAPVVTFHHFTSPRWIAARGGWEDAGVIDRFARYCERAARALGGLFGHACTLNEPNAQVTSFVVAGGKPFAGEARVRAEAARAVGSDRFGAFFQGDALRARDNILAAHRKAVAAIKGAAPDVKVGMTLALQQLSPGPGGEALYGRIFEAARAPFYAAANADDFVGVQTYERNVIGPGDYLKAAPGPWLNAWGSDVSPGALAAVVREARAHCRAPVFVTEHGLNTTDDAQRVRHLTASLTALKTVIDEGAPVLGYMHWSLLDNFEWSSGYAPRFGLVAIDRRTFARAPKPSAAAYRDLVRSAAGRW